MKMPIMRLIVLLGTLTTATASLAADPVLLIPFGAVWKYLDDGSNQGIAWASPTFQDETWASGPGEFGYGDGGEATLLDFGGNASEKHTTYYFRHTLNVPDPGQYFGMTALVRYDDGAVVYVNGTEAGRINMPAGPIFYDTFANSATEYADEPLAISPALFVPGLNVIAVEVHQGNLTSSDVSFDLRLEASTEVDFSLSSPAENDFFVAPATILLAADTSKFVGGVDLVEFFEGETELAEDALAPFEYIWSGVPVGIYELSAVATYGGGSRATTAVVHVSVGATSAPFIIARDPVPGTVSELNIISVTFNESVTGMEAQWLQVNGEPAVAMIGGGSIYTFAFTQPLPGIVQVAWDVDHSIVDLQGNGFDDTAAGAKWTYTLVDNVAPQVTRLSPASGARVSSLTQVEVLFNEPVTGVDAADLQVKGQAAQSVTGQGAGPYVFTFAQPTSGAVSMAWAGDHQIQDEADSPNAFAGGSWNYVLDASAPTSVVLNEILADNLTSLVDEDGQKNDWIELYNPGASAVGLLGWSLTDDPANPGKWVLPNLTLNPGQYRIFFASGKDRKPTAAGTTNHTNFRLGVTGGYLGLYNANYPRQVVSEFAPGYPESRGDISYGRNLGGVLAWFSVPTPGSANATAFAVTGIVEAPHAAVNSGLFDHPFDLALSVATPGASIRYTLDGSVPTLDSEEYFAPIRVEGNPRRGVATVRATAFLPGHLPSTITTRTFIFPEHVLTQPADPDGLPSVWDSPGGLQDSVPDYEMDPEIVNAGSNRQRIRNGLATIPSLSIVTDPDLIWSPSEGYYVRKTYDDDSLNNPLVQACNAELIVPDGAGGGFNADAGVRIVGGTSPDNQGTYPTAGWKSRKLSMRLLFKGEFGANKLRAKVFPDSDVDTFDTLVIDAGLNYVWSYNGGSSTDDQRLRAQYVRDQYMSDLQNALGGAAPHGRYVHVYLNGLYWGLHDLHERPDEDFASAYLGGEADEYDALKHNAGDVLAGSAATYTAMYSLARTGLAANNVYLQLQQTLDIPALIDYMLVNFWAGNTDWAHQNWYATHRQGPEGRWRYHNWDAEHVLKSRTEDVTAKNDANGPTEMLQLLRANEEFRVLFGDHVHRHFFNGGTFFVDAANPSYDPAHPERNRPAALWMRRVDEVASDPMVAESARWGDTGQTGTSRANNPLTYDRDFLDELDALMGRRNPAGHGSSFNYFPQRSAVVLGQLRADNLYPALDAPVFSQHGGRVGLGYALTMAAPGGGTIYYSTTGVDPRVFGSGAVSPQAQIYTPGNPLILTESTEVKARVRSGTAWSALNEAIFLVESLTLPIRITEIMYHPIGEDTYEFLELRNIGQTPLDLAGYSFSGINFAFPIGSMLSPGATIVLANNANPAEFAARYPGVTVSGYFGGNLSNGGERLTLMDPAGVHVLSVSYDDEGGWPVEADGGGASLELVDVNGDLSDPANWQASPLSGGTPGLPPSPAPPLPSVRLNEFMCDNLSAVDHEGTFPDYVELYNAGPDPVSLEGWSLTDGANPLQFVFGPGAVLPAGDYLVVWLDSLTNTTSGIHAGFALDRDGDGLFLYDATLARVDAVTFGLLPTDFSLGRIDGEWVLNEATPNAANQAAPLADASFLGLNEWLANPAPGQDDWIELYNRSATLPVSLRGIYLGSATALSELRAHAYLGPQSFIQLFAEERSGPDELDFRLPAEGGSIALYDSAGNALEQVDYASQSEGVSEGRIPDGDGDTQISFFGSVSPEAGNYVLNYSGPALHEVLARNVTSVLSPWGTYADFVEIRNGGGTPYDLGGMGLGARLDPLDRFLFPPNTILPAGAYLVVWWDGSTPAMNAPGGPWNTGESLDGQGEEIYLFSAAGQPVDSVAYGFQATDLSIGVSAGSWKLLAQPTPNAANAGPAALGQAVNLRINEWMADPEAGDDWFELFNGDSLPVQMDGLLLADTPALNARMRFGVPALSFIDASGHVRWEADGQVDNGPNHVNFSLDGAGESILLYAPNGAVIDSISFERQRQGASQGRWPDGAAGWVDFPGSASPARSNFLPIPDVAINEALAHTDLPLEDAIELVNLGASPLDIGGWFLSDEESQLKKYRVPDGTTLPAGGFEVVYENQLLNGPGAIIPFSLDSVRGDEIWLSEANSNGSLTGRRAVATIGASANGVSLGRFVTSVGVDYPSQVTHSFGIDNPLSVTQFRTGQGKDNTGPRIGPVVLNEIHYQLPGTGSGQSEYIELFNTTDSEADLFHPLIPELTWRLEGGVTFAFPLNVTVPAKSYLLLVDFDPVNNPVALAAFRALHGIPGSVPILGPLLGRLDDSGERIELVRPDTPQGPGPDEGYVPSILVDGLDYDDQYPWSELDLVLGSSLQRRRPYDYSNDPVNWKGASPTPGRANVAGGGFVDSDLDGMTDDFEIANDLDEHFPGDASLDPDGDGRDSFMEYLDGTDPQIGASVLQGPSLTTQPVSQMASPGMTVVFTVVAQGSAPLRYQWYRDDLAIDGATLSTLTLAFVNSKYSGTYHAAVWNDAGYTVSARARLSVVVPPRISQQPQSQSLSNGLTATFTVEALGTGLLRYQWKYNGEGIPGATDSIYTLDDVQLEDDGVYTVVVTDDITSIESDPAVLKVLQWDGITWQPVSQTVVEGSTVTFTVHAHGTLPIYYRWRRGFATIRIDPLHSFVANYTLSNVTLADSGARFSCVVTNQVFQAPGDLSNTAILTVLPDGDKDGMDDAYEMAHGFFANDPSDGGGDADNDDVTNRQEYDSGTDPLDPENYLRVDIAPTPADPEARVAIQFRAQAGKSYSVLYRDEVGLGAWQKLTDVELEAAARDVQIMDPTAGSLPRRFYQLVTPKWLD